MLGIFTNRIFATAFAAQVIALIGTGLLTVALGLLAFDLAGDRAGAVLGTALAIKMVAYVGLSPIANALAERLPRKTVLVAADLVRASIALFLPFIDAVWQIYVLIFILQAASATFTPAFQATIPDILENEQDYTKALSLSRMATDLENLLSPALAGLLLLVASYHWLFIGTAAGLLASAMLIGSARIPPRQPSSVSRRFSDRLTRGMRIYLATPRLRGLLALNLCGAAMVGFVLVNTVVVVRVVYTGSEIDVAIALAAFGLGSVVAAIVLPPLLTRVSDRTVMLGGGHVLALLTLLLALVWLAQDLPAWPVFLAIWTVAGFLFSVIATPSGRLLRRSAHPEDRPAIFTAQFALSHACYLVTYLMAGLLGDAWDLPVALVLLGVLALAGAIAATRLWPADDPEVLLHEHANLSADHPHLRDHAGGRRHRHVFVIDDDHPQWPATG